MSFETVVHDECMPEKVIHPQVYGTSQILKMVLPLILSLLIEQVIGLTDVIFLGRVGEIELGASALAGVMYLSVVMFGFGYCFSLQAFMGQKNGEKDYLSMGEAMHSGTLFLMLFSVILMAVAFMGSTPFLARVVESPEIAVATEKYFFWRAVGIPFTFLAAVARGFFIATLNPRIITVSSIVMMLSNIVLDYVLIFGYGSIPAMGISGAAIASTIAEVLGFFVLFIYAMRRANPERYQFWHRPTWNWDMQKRLFKLGRWLMVQEGVVFVSWLYFFVSVEHLGPAALAISNVVRQISSLFYLFIHSFGSTAGAICANLIGERRFDEITAVYRRTLYINCAVIFPLAILVALLPQQALGIFTNIEDILVGGVPTLYVLLSSFIFAGISMFYSFAMSGMGLTKETSIASMTSVIFYVVYIFFITQVSDNVAVVWTSEYIYNITIGVVCWYFFRQHRWRIV